MEVPQRIDRLVRLSRLAWQGKMGYLPLIYIKQSIQRSNKKFGNEGDRIGKARQHP